MTCKRKQIRDLIASKRLIRLVGAHNGLTAKLVEDNGFDGVWASGLEISAARLVPDASILTMTEFLDVADEMNQAVSIPVVADCDSGFGDPRNVARLVHEYERFDIAGICIEDSQFPKLNSYAEGDHSLLPILDFVDKIHSAVDTRRDHDFLIIARTEAFVAGTGLGDALARASAYQDAGADAILVHSRSQTADELAEFTKKWQGKLPVVAVPTSYPDVSLDQLQEFGIRIIIYANVVIRTIVCSINQALGTLGECGTLSSVTGHMCPLSELFQLQDFYYRKLHYCSDAFNVIPQLSNT